jgi:hypothetical protein
MLPYPFGNLKQNIQPLSWLAEPAENQSIPTSHIQHFTKLTNNLGYAWLLGQFEVEAADATPVAFEAEKAAIRALVGYVQVERVA